MDSGSTIQRSDLRVTTTIVKRYKKVGIALAVTKLMHLILSSGVGSPITVIFHNLSLFGSSRNTETSVLICNSAGFVGDSLNRNMFVALFCNLKQVPGEVRKWRPAGADRGFTFLQYNLTIAYHRTNLLACYGRWSANPNGGVLESLGYKEGYRVDVDTPEGTWVEAASFHDILIFNTGHWWWAPSKFDPVKSPMLFFEKGSPVVPTIPPDAGLDMVLKHMVSFLEGKTRSNTVVFFRIQCPRHFEGGDWDQGGSCLRLQPFSPQKVSLLL
ncbi:unnamed protein product [Ilex paraguariensis]|uniref:Trichome birefringence-like C-terminal domain-containing protein n=1 Tax=Ilex paraguariensis TaxID=185542 RepID=A0ABC8TF49_9AQUA